GRVAPDLAGQIGRHPELDHVVPAPASHRAYSASTSNPRSARRITVRCRACGSRATFWVRNATASVAVPVSPGRRRLLMTTPLFRSRQRKGWYEARPRAGRARGRHRDGAARGVLGHAGLPRAAAAPAAVPVRGAGGGGP